MNWLLSKNSSLNMITNYRTAYVQMSAFNYILEAGSRLTAGFQKEELITVRMLIHPNSLMNVLGASDTSLIYMSGASSNIPPDCEKYGLYINSPFPSLCLGFLALMKTILRIQDDCFFI